MTSLGSILIDLACKASLTLKELTVLSHSNDPFRIGSPTTHKNGEWLRDQMRDHGLLNRASPIHNRGIHYAIASAGNVRRPDGSPYINDLECWEWLESTSKAARWLGYVGFDQISDARNTEPVIRPLPVTALVSRCGVEFGDYSLPDDFEPEVMISSLNVIQKYRLVFWGEKTSLAGVLGPLAEEFEADLFLPSGESSDTQLYIMAKTGAIDGREMIVLVFTDCDPAGHQMAISIAHKLRAFKEGFLPGLKFQVHAVALTVEQVKQLGLPSTPLKETEKRADGWRERYGVEQTEIDALATLRPDLLRQIVRDAAEPFFDATLKDRISQAESDWEDEAYDRLNQALDANSEFLTLREQARSALKTAKAAARRMRQIVDDIDIELPEAPEIEPETGETPHPLVSSEMEMLEAIRVLKARKDYTNGRG
jgi:hypothetical protein